ncbi:MAG: hypothetical protein MJ152_04280, partial [Clostridia bacterium]|nr:hypothetical protein [Clostridia bacterium]
MFKSFYNQFVNFIQGIPGVWFVIAWLLLISLAFICIVRFFKIYNGTQKNFEKVSLIIIAVL